MDFSHCDISDHLLTRKCSCGGDPEMIIVFVYSIKVRCSQCHSSTLAYVKPEVATKHWNDGIVVTDTYGISSRLIPKDTCRVISLPSQYQILVSEESLHKAVISKQLCLNIKTRFTLRT